MEAPIAVPDVAGTYAEQIRQHLASSPSPRTVPEICDALSLSDRLVRMGLDRLVFTKSVNVSLRHEAHRRGAIPRQYHLAAA
jgi:hypothetical protein